MKFEAILGRRRDNSLGEYKENALLTAEILNTIEEEHCLKIKKVHKNVYLNFNKKGIEFDVLIEALTPSEQIRWISIELKESDISKVINQAIMRREFVDYSYVVLNSHIKWIVQYLFYVWHKEVKEYKIGFFSNDILILNSKYIKSKIEIKLKR